jgi:hypothetical protein
MPRQTNVGAGFPAKTTDGFRVAEVASGPRRQNRRSQALLPLLRE